MGFTSELVVQQVEDFEWKVVTPLQYEGNTDRFTVPADFETDFASIPTLFQWLLPRSGRYTKPAVLHDYLCRFGTGLGCPVEDADGLFRRSMAEMKVPFLRRWVMWAAVRLRSLWNSRLHAGPTDIPQVLLIVAFPGVFLIVGALVDLALLLGWFVIEAFVALLMLVLRTLLPPVRTRTKPVTTPKLRWAA